MRLEKPSYKIEPFCAVDFETYFDKNYSLSLRGDKAMTVSEYCAHPSFNAYLVSLCFWTGKEWLLWAGHPDDAPWDDINGKLWISHNADFDSEVYLTVLRNKRLPVNESAVPRQWLCTVDMATYMQAGISLQAAVEAVFNVKLDKSVRDRMVGGGEGLTEKEIIDYATDDAIWCANLWVRLERWWPDEEKAISDQTRRMNRRGYHVDVRKAEAYRNQINEELKLATPELPWFGRDSSTSTKRFDAYMTKRGHAPPNSKSGKDEEFLAWKDNLPDALRSVVVAFQTVQKLEQMGAWLDKIQSKADSSGMVRGGLRYCAAIHTRRWQTDNRIRLQNLDREPFKGIDLRSVITPRPGYVFVILDFSQIEPRVLHWLAGDEEFLAYCRSGMSPYEAHARSSMGYTGTDPLKKADLRQYTLSKIRMLSLGYQAGTHTLVLQARSYGLPMEYNEVAFTDDGMELPAAKDVVRSYRESNPRIVHLWDKFERDARRHVGKDWSLPLPCGQIRYFGLRHSGRVHMSKPVIEACVLKSTKNQKHWREIYGGKLTENAVQAIARYALRDAILRVESTKLADTMFHVHDEVVLEIPEGEVDERVPLLVDAFQKTPTWAPGLPIATEPLVTDHYTK